MPLRLFNHKGNIKTQILTGILLVVVVSAICYSLSDLIGYRIVAMLLLVTVSLIAMFFSIVPVLVTALLSALIWNFFFIPPQFTFHIDNTEDILMFCMYFVIAIVNAALTIKIRQVEKETRKQEQRERTLELYNTLLSSLSHELRTPISTIIGASDALYSSNGKLSETSKSELVSEICSASLRLNQQVENLLNMSRLESGFLQLKKDWVDIAELIHTAVRRVEQDQVSQQFSIQIGHDIPLFKLDEGMMEQVIYNLVFNAVHYTPEGSPVEISAEGDEDGLRIVIRDYGNGFPEEEIPKVFDKFYRLKNSRTGGTGLGLSIVKGFVEAHEGKIILENRPEGGAIFTIHLPAEATYVKNLKHE